jgi:hypothetical protein
MQGDKSSLYRAPLYRAASDIPYLSADADTYIAPIELRHLKKKSPLRVLSEKDWDFWRSYGYVIVKQAIPLSEAKKLLDFAWEFQDMDPNRPETWYPEKTFKTKLERDLYVWGFVEAYHHQLLWNSRQSERVYGAFADVWDCEELWVTLDRLNLNPPNIKNRDRALIPSKKTGFDILLHWDIDTTLEVLPQRVQGIIALNDSTTEQGGFQCAPELFRQFDAWKTTQPPDRDPIRPKIDQAEFPIVMPELKAGDLLIWNGLLAHGVAQNRSENGVRAVQYLAMMPALESRQELRQSRIDSWRYLKTPEWNKTLVGDAVRHESLRYPTAELNELGKKLLGLELWRAQEIKIPAPEVAKVEV